MGLERDPPLNPFPAPGRGVEGGNRTAEEVPRAYSKKKCARFY